MRNAKPGLKKTGIPSSKKCAEMRGEHPDHSKELIRLNRIEGQVAGIRKMIHEGRYCPQIIQQIRATRSALLAMEGILLEVHLRRCVTDAMRSKDPSQRDQKIQELLQIFIRAGKHGVSP